MYTRIKISALCILLSIMGLSAFLHDDINTDIIGTWIAVDDEEHKLVLDDTTLSIYINDVLEDQYNYEITSQDCTGSNSPIEITYLVYTYDDSDDIDCNQVSIRNDHLTIIEYPTATITEYVRE